MIRYTVNIDVEYGHEPDFYVGLRTALSRMQEEGFISGWSLDRAVPVEGSPDV